MSEEKILLDSFYYSYEEGSDAIRDATETIEELLGEWQGELRIVITFEPKETPHD